MSAPAFQSKLQRKPAGGGAGGKKQQQTKKTAPPRRTPASSMEEDDDQQHNHDNDDDDNDDSSSGEDSDAEIELNAPTNVKATVKPLAQDAPQPPAAKPNPKKRKSEAAQEDDDKELIDVEFGIYDPKPIDYLTLKMLLKDYVISNETKKKKKSTATKASADDMDEGADDEESAATPAPAPTPLEPDFALHELCDAIVEQAAVGGMVKGEGTDEPLGFLTALSFDWQQKYAKNIDGVKGAVVWIDQLKKYLVGRAPSNLKATFQQALSSPKTGLLIQGRLINVPPQIIPQLHESLQLDLAWAKEHAGLYGKQFEFAQFILIARKFKPQPGSKAASQRGDVLASAQFVDPFAKPKKKKQKGTDGQATSAASSSGEEYEWLRFEEELYARAATAQYSFHCPFTAEDAAAGRQPQSCVVMIVPAKALPGIVEELKLMAAMS